MSMPLKEGTVRWRMTRTQADADHNEHRVAALERWQGQPTGAFSADEFIAGREARRGVELCTIVETMYSLGVMAQNGSVGFADRLERIAINALPAALTGDPDSFARFRPYLAQFPPVVSRFLRVFTVSPTVPTSCKPEPRAKRQWQGRPNTISAAQLTPGVGNAWQRTCGRTTT